MLKSTQEPHNHTQKDKPTAAGSEEPLHETALLLPVPDQAEVAGFIALYQAEYGVELEPEKAHEILGGLMRFLYLTRRGTRVQPLDG